MTARISIAAWMMEKAVIGSMNSSVAKTPSLMSDTMFATGLEIRRRLAAPEAPRRTRTLAPLEAAKIQAKAKNPRPLKALPLRPHRPLKEAKADQIPGAR